MFTITRAARHYLGLGLGTLDLGAPLAYGSIKLFRDPTSSKKGYRLVHHQTPVIQ